MKNVIWKNVSRVINTKKLYWLNKGKIIKRCPIKQGFIWRVYCTYLQHLSSLVIFSRSQTETADKSKDSVKSNKKPKLTCGKKINKTDYDNLRGKFYFWLNWSDWLQFSTLLTIGPCSMFVFHYSQHI